ncbi:DNA-binding transcriptional ArsR family regulator [Allocatelliglobosispora scoriae]|uniref:DNA-binding transcriptional ArsR family regulator n=1 Tax=Allocatelliglobosispora scoriae TaxID=643052 RepID=A0A841BZN8_9ACTN|nr:winged helix-turn-helix domain-containing protein [Allocatelliglobosispora scoriae]MBB5872363.1 DNA-binding transcriptional ArsR family regulator [Allocatelliglobosispora scoriae]
MTEIPEIMEVSSAAQYSALGHPLRLRVLFALGEQPATISQLAASLGSRKGNIAHHLAVLREAGLVRHSHTRQVRGGTEQYFSRTARRLHFVGEQAGAQSAAALKVVAEEIGQAAPDPFLVLRHVRLTREQVDSITAALAHLVEGIEEAPEGSPRFGVLLGVYEPSASRSPADRETSDE